MRVWFYSMHFGLNKKTQNSLWLITVLFEEVCHGHMEDAKASAWPSCQIRKLAGCACAGNAGNIFFPTPRVSDPDMHHGTCVTHVPWCMPGLLTSDFLWSRLRVKRSRLSRRMRNPQVDLSGKSLLTCYMRLTYVCICVKAWLPRVICMTLVPYRFANLQGFPGM